MSSGMTCDISSVRARAFAHPAPNSIGGEQRQGSGLRPLDRLEAPHPFSFLFGLISSVRFVFTFIYLSPLGLRKKVLDSSSAVPI